ncbi:MAG: hypothetical protein COU25_03660 [Candidatus Levybacteria bacterium CG10_big_fil_rev_8_21_14_0_10_35_13]|nr:MAG: hypothetical protein COU25_03660 [Candidatus Levybacteria bacterium CG10_big_fil_rev_8_21_14_0_10_35_13]
MICIRFFKTRRQAQWGKKVLEEGGISAEISEDKLWGIPIARFGVRARFRLNVLEQDFNRAVNFLAKRLKKLD